MKDLLPKTKDQVMLHHCDGYAQELVDPIFKKIVSPLCSNENFHDKVVLLKPNLISGRGTPLACTNPRIIAAAARYFLEKGAKVRVGDSPAYGLAEDVMKKHKMLSHLEGMDVEIVNFRTPAKRTLENGVSVEIAAEVIDCDFLVNLPKLKAHNQMYITGAVKNFFGTVVGMRKAMMHMRNGGSHSEFSDILIRLPEMLPPHISVMDGIEVMHGSGPLDGDSLRLNCLAASRCPVALDTAMLLLLELPLENSPLWQAASAMGMYGSFPDNHQYPLASPVNFKRSGFKAPETLNPIRFNPFRLLVSSFKRFTLAFRP